MKKSLIALAVAGVFVAPVAMADVTIYGAANVSIDVVSNGLVAPVAAAAATTTTPAVVAQQSATTTHVSSNVSKIGFKGSEDLGDGLSAIWQIEQQVNIDNAGATSGFGTRNTYAGLSSANMGTVLLGRHDTPYKIATRGLDLFADTAADNRSIMGLAGLHDARLTDVIAYISPAMGGVTLAVATVTGAETAGNVAPGTSISKGGAWSLAAMYNGGPINASLSYQVIDNGSAGTGTMGSLVGGAQANPDNKAKAWKLGGSYTMDAFQVNAIYEKTTSSGNNATTIPGALAPAGTYVLGNALDRSAIYLGGKFNVSANDAVKLAYTSAGKLNNVANTEGNQVSVGYDHNLSKRTTVYALYSKISNKTAQGYTLSQATSAAGAPSYADADPSVFSLGMKHSF